MGRDQPLEARPGAASVASSDGCRQGRHANTAAATAIARVVADTGETHDLASRTNPDAIGACAADHRHSPGSVASGTQGGVGVVEHDDLVGEPAVAQPALEQTDVARQVGSGQGVDALVCHWAAVDIQTGQLERLAHARLEVVEARLEADRLVRDGRAADDREERPVGGHERDVGLRVAAVDGQDRRLGGPRAAFGAFTLGSSPR